MKKILLVLLLLFTGLNYSQTSLAGTSPASSYGGLLHFGNNTGLTTSLQTVYDGLGNVSALQLSTLGVNVVGTFYLNGVAFTGVTSVTGTSPIVSSGGTTPIISLGVADTSHTQAKVITVAGRTGIISLSTTDISGLGSMAKADSGNYHGSASITTLGTITTGSVDTTYTNAVSKINSGVGIIATKNSKDYTINVDTNTTVLSKAYALANYQPKGLYLIPSDSTANRTFSDLKYQVKGIYLVPGDSTAFRIFSDAKYQAKATYLVPSDSTANRTYSDVKYTKYSDTASVIATKAYAATLIPAQTGLAGYFLSTNGTNTAWAVVPGGGDMLKAAYATRSAARVDSAFTADTVAWSGITGKPTLGTMSAADSTYWNTKIGSSSDTLYKHTFTDTTSWTAFTGRNYAATYRVTIDARAATTGNLYVVVDSSLTPETVNYGVANYFDNVASHSIAIKATQTGDVSTASYASKSFSVNAQNSSPAGIFLSPDGTKMYMLGRATNITEYEYTLSTAGDVSTASYASKSFNSNSIDANSYNVRLSPDGTKMYVNGWTNHEIYQFTLATPWDVSTASNSGGSLTTTTQDIYPYGYCFDTTGTKLYIVGSNTKTVYEYILSTAWSVSTASYASKSFLVSSQDATPRDVSLSPDGTKMYVLGNTNKTVYQYTLSTAGDVSTASYAGISLSVNAQDSSPTDMFLSPDGTKMYVLGYTNKTVYQYNIPLSFTGAVYASVIMNPGTSNNAPAGYTVATLPAGTLGMTAYCTDLTSPTYGATAVGGGTVKGLVFYNGTNWVTE